MTIATKYMSILKGDEFTERVRNICSNIPIVEGRNLKYKRILIPGVWGGELIFARLGFLAHALSMRGAEVTCLLCDQILPACSAKKVFHHESACTRWCYKNAGPFAEAMQLNYRWYSDFISTEERDRCTNIAAGIHINEIPEFKWRDFKLGEHIMRSLESYYLVGTPDLGDPSIYKTACELLEAALYLAIIGERAMDELQIEKVLLLNGLKNTWGVMREVAKKKDIPSDIIRSGLRGYSFMFETERPSQPAVIMSEWPHWREIPLTTEQENTLDRYFLRREKVPYEHRRSVRNEHVDDIYEIRHLIGLPDHISGIIFGLFTNVGFDAGLTKYIPAFESTEEWVIQTINFFKNHTEHQLIIKAHPGEKLRDVRDPLEKIIAKNIVSLPGNIHFIPPDTSITAHGLIRILDVVLVYTSTVTVEAASLGKPVVIVGGGWHARRGFTMDVYTPQQYFELLTTICSGKLTLQPCRELARRYAYYLFYRANIPFNLISTMDHEVADIHISSLADLAPGMDPALDVICNGILFDDPFSLPE